ncbi:bis(5'-nucleosyl)-tetraphosphatase (symmetrical) YqeK [Gracilibacillus caseinilyticus]|uniref:bis(5'-nucleosyl)-tetraphosphatase (symmetrical) n=1 Tax=Gracilibacillus caseinilyticus TaxID=2932256 RepID=A0ABY4ETH0_9BACI|nr:bis(5'-nucleosyl)-tetraphosphatase (symmetrical) YqeK [Gracilibacillus caseinilyticus]UOQ47371.1 bis(5'-nucleosyl)-tetraphosphatase (symmetrical) YqeK [Gracilibacillus caseinilyticus]
MNRAEALKIVERQLTKKRYEHTVRVMETALDIAGHYQVDRQKVELAAIFHDYAKYRHPEEMKRWIIQEKLPHDLLEYHQELWHGPVGSVMIEREVGISDPEIQSAIYWHTTGKRNMTLMDKIIFIADYVEPGREFAGVEEVRGLVFENIDRACWLAARNTIQFLMGKEQPVYPDTFQLYNEKIGRNMNG